MNEQLEVLRNIKRLATYAVILSGMALMIQWLEQLERIGVIGPG